MKEVNSGRRNLLAMMTIGAAMPVYGYTSHPSLAHGADHVPLVLNPVRLVNIHTKEHLVIQLDKVRLNEYDTQQQINHFLRDHRQNKKRSMDLALIEQLHQLQLAVGGNQAFEVICGYRTKATNDLLRKKSRGVAKHSYHLQGRAIDVRLPGTKTRLLKDAAVAMEVGGVGYYPKSDFIHLDTGDVRNWDR